MFLDSQFHTKASLLSGKGSYPKILSDKLKVQPNFKVKCFNCNQRYTGPAGDHVCQGPVKHLVCTWSQCDYRTFRADHLKIHIRKHTGEKPYICRICDYRCNQKSQLNMHLFKKHGQN